MSSVGHSREERWLQGPLTILCSRYRQPPTYTPCPNPNRCFQNEHILATATAINYCCGVGGKSAVNLKKPIKKPPIQIYVNKLLDVSQIIRLVLCKVDSLSSTQLTSFECGLLIAAFCFADPFVKPEKQLIRTELNPALPDLFLYNLLFLL